MRYSKEHKEGVRSQLLSESGSYAKKHGFAATGVDALANAAGLTTGSLYKHFSNKNDLFTAVITAEIGRTVQVFENMNPDDMGTILKALASYLSMQHVHSPETGCLLPSLTAEVARANDDAHLAFEAGMLRFKDVVKEMTGSDTVAWTVIAQNVGAIMIARAMQHESAKEEIINAVRTTGAQLLVEAFEKK